MEIQLDTDKYKILNENKFIVQNLSKAISIKLNSEKVWELFEKKKQEKNTHV